MSVDASSVPARAPGALVDVDLTVGAVEALVAVAAERVGEGDAVAVVARISGAMVHVGTVTTWKLNFDIVIILQVEAVSTYDESFLM